MQNETTPLPPQPTSPVPPQPLPPAPTAASYSAPGQSPTVPVTVATPPPTSQPPAPPATAQPPETHWDALKATPAGVDETLQAAITKAVTPEPPPPPKKRYVKEWAIFAAVVVLASAAILWAVLSASANLDQATDATATYSSLQTPPYDGKIVTSGNGAFSVRIPAGSEIVSDTRADALTFTKLREEPGKDVAVAYVDKLGGGTRQLLTVTTKPKVDFSFELEALTPDKPFYADGVQCLRYVKEYKKSEALAGGEAEGGEKNYVYVFNHGENRTIVNYFIQRDAEDKHELVEKMALTLRFRDNR